MSSQLLHIFQRVPFFNRSVIVATRKEWRDRCVKSSASRNLHFTTRQISISRTASRVRIPLAEGKARSWIAHRLPLTLGWELAGIVEKLGDGVKHFKIGDEVFGMIDLSGDGAAAEYALGDEIDFAMKPKSLDYTKSAAVPIAAITAHQALFDVADLRSGQTLLVHAAAGGVGSMAVQLAKSCGARVIATASGAEHLPLIRKLGCDEAIDYKETRFENQVREVDVVLDPIGRDTQSRSLDVLKEGGILVSLMDQPPEDIARARGVRTAIIGIKPDGKRLADLAKLIDEGKFQPVIQTTFPLAQAREAIQLSHSRHVTGKIVLTQSRLADGCQNGPTRTNGAQRKGSDVELFLRRFRLAWCRLSA